MQKLEKTAKLIGQTVSLMCAVLEDAYDVVVFLLTLGITLVFCYTSITVSNPYTMLGVGLMFGAAVRVFFTSDVKE